jgi:hypothetical protein
MEDAVLIGREDFRSESTTVRSAARWSVNDDGKMRPAWAMLATNNNDGWMVIDTWT